MAKSAPKFFTHAKEQVKVVKISLCKKKYNFSKNQVFSNNLKLKVAQSVASLSLYSMPGCVFQKCVVGKY